MFNSQQEQSLTALTCHGPSYITLHNEQTNSVVMPTNVTIVNRYNNKYHEHVRSGSKAIVIVGSFLLICGIAEVILSTSTILRTFGEGIWSGAFIVAVGIAGCNITTNSPKTNVYATIILSWLGAVLGSITVVISSVTIKHTPYDTSLIVAPIHQIVLALTMVIILLINAFYIYQAAKDNLKCINGTAVQANRPQIAATEIFPQQRSVTVAARNEKMPSNCNLGWCAIYFSIFLIFIGIFCVGIQAFAIGELNSMDNFTIKDALFQGIWGGLWISLTGAVSLFIHLGRPNRRNPMFLLTFIILGLLFSLSFFFISIWRLAGETTRYSKMQGVLCTLAVISSVFFIVLICLSCDELPGCSKKTNSRISVYREAVVYPYNNEVISPSEMSTNPPRNQMAQPAITSSPCFENRVYSDISNEETNGKPLPE